MSQELIVGDFPYELDAGEGYPFYFIGVKSTKEEVDYKLIGVSHVQQSTHAIEGYTATPTGGFHTSYQRAVEALEDVKNGKCWRGLGIEFEE